MQLARSITLSMALVAGCGSGGSGSGAVPDASGAVPDASGAVPDASATGAGGLGGSGTRDSGTDCELEIHYGQGAAVVAGNWSSAELAVRLTCGGVARAAESVTWSLAQGDGVLGATASSPPASAIGSETDADGIARAVYRHPSLFSQPSWSNVPGTVIASSSAGSVELAVTAFNPGGNAPLLPYASIVFPAGAGNGASLGSGKPNGVISGALRVAVANAAGAYTGQGVPNIGVRLFGDDDDALHCIGDGYTALTDATGIATCDLRLPATPGEHVFDLDVGRVLKWQGLSVKVAP